MGLLPDTQNCGFHMRQECRERFPRHRLHRKQPVSDPGMHHGTCVTHVLWCMSGLLSRPQWRGKHYRHPRRMRNPQFCVSGKRPMVLNIQDEWVHLLNEEWLQMIACAISILKNFGDADICLFHGINSTRQEIITNELWNCCVVMWEYVWCRLCGIFIRSVDKIESHREIFLLVAANLFHGC